MKILSIVIPSFNTEKFIDKNMKTFIDNKLFQDVEILLINDGSTDSTAENIERYQAQFPGYVRAINKPNGNHGSVINKGIDEANGKYFKVIDADDWVDTDNLIQLVEYLKHQDVDLIVNPYVTFNEGNEQIRIFTNFSNVEYGKTYDINKLLNTNITKLALHSISVRTELLREHKIKLTEGCFYDDFQYWLYPIFGVKTVSFFELPVYYYLIGQPNQSVNPEKAFKNIGMSIKVYEDSLQWYQKHSSSMNEEKNIFFKNSIAGFAKSIYNTYLRNYRLKTSYQMMLEMDGMIRGISNQFYIYMIQKYAYIKLAKSNKIAFNFVAKMLNVYKKIKKDV